ncbi:MAG: DegT/DnrJ/EryC1/StrS family aminotransferase [bacterium]
MNLKIPSAATPIRLHDISAGLRPAIHSKASDFRDIFSGFTGLPFCYFVNSGTAAFYVILKALSRLSPANEVILPAYTAPSLILPVRKAGLRPVLCDVDKESYGFDTIRLSPLINRNTLCVVVVHMFGLPGDVRQVKGRLKNKGVFIVEDAASSLGSEIRGARAGSLGDVSFFSFNRGKNLTTYCGGCIATRMPSIANEVEQVLSSVIRRKPLFDLLVPFKLTVLSLAMRPLVYTALFKLISQFKHTRLHYDFDCFQFTRFQAKVGKALFQRLEQIRLRRHENGRLLLRGLQGLPGLTLPRVDPNTFVVFNQFPVLVDDQGVRKALLERLLGLGLEATTLYPEPMQKVYPELNLGATQDLFPVASYIAEHLLLLPVHPLVPKARLQQAVAVFRSTVHALSALTPKERPKRFLEARGKSSRVGHCCSGDRIEG